MLTDPVMVDGASINGLDGGTLWGKRPKDVN